MASRISQRFLNPKIQVRLAHFAMAGVALDKSSPISWSEQIMSMLCNNLNVTDVNYDFDTNGFPDENGTYNGLIGFIQRDGADIAPNIIRPDSLPFEPVKVSWPLIPGDIAILTAVNKSTDIYLDLTDVVYNFNETTYAFIGLTIFLVSLLISAKVLKEQENKHCRVVELYLESLWNIFTTILDQEYFVPKCGFQKVSWLFFNFTSFILVFGYFLNLMSTDQFVRDKPPAIESLRDLLYEKQFEDVMPAILKQLHLYNLLKNADLKSDYGKLYKRMLRTENRSIVELDLQGMSTESVSEDSPSKVLVDDIGKGRTALCGPRISLELYATLMPNYFDGKVLHVAKETFLKGTFNLFTSKNIHRGVLEVFNYRLLTFVELDISRPFLDNNIIRDMYDICNSCERQKFEAKKYETLPVVVNLSLFPLTKSFRMLYFGFLASLVMLLLENVYKGVSFCMLRKQERNRTLSCVLKNTWVNVSLETYRERK